MLCEAHGHQGHGADGTTVHDRSRPINLIVSSEPIQQREVNKIPHARSLPIAQAAPTPHPRPAPEFLREHVPGNAAAEDKQNADETRAIGDARPSAFRPTKWSLARTVQQDPTTDREAAPRPYPFTLLRRRGSGFGGFVTCSSHFRDDRRLTTRLSTRDFVLTTDDYRLDLLFPARFLDRHRGVRGVFLR